MLHKNFGTARTSVVLLVLVVAAGLAGCGAGGSGGLYGTNSSSSSSSSSGSSTSAKTTCASSSALICTRSVQVNGTTTNALVTSAGMTLYYFTPDSATSSACMDSCAKNWPPLLSSSATVAPISGLSGTLATISRSEGNQISYNGHPLYTYAADSAPGDAKGEGVLGKWYVATVSLAPASGSNDNGYGG